MMTKKTSLKNALCRQIAIIPVLAVSIFLFSTKTFSQNTVIAPKAIQPNIPSSQDGVSQELLDEYDQIVDKAKNEKGFPEHATFSEADKSRLQTIYTQMSKVQQAKQIVIFMSAPPPLPRSAPTQAQIESWKDSKIYGVWINSKRVSNSELNKYQHTDFAQLFVSKLAKNTVNYGKHYYQVNLMTKEAYETYYKEANDAKNKYLIGVRMHRKDKKGNDVEVVWMVS